MMPSPLRVVGISLGLPMDDLLQTFLSVISSSALLSGKEFPLFSRFIAKDEIQIRKALCLFMVIVI